MTGLNITAVDAAVSAFAAVLGALLAIGTLYLQWRSARLLPAAAQGTSAGSAQQGASEAPADTGDGGILTDTALDADGDDGPVELRAQRWLTPARMAFPPLSAIAAGLVVLLIAGLLSGPASASPGGSAGISTPGPRSSSIVSPSPSTTHSSSPTPRPLPPGISVAPHLPLNGSNMCAWRLGTSPMPLKSLKPLRIRIDGRCNYPEDANPKTDSPTGVYSVTDQIQDDTVAALRDGTVMTLRCFSYGQFVSDAIGNATTLWLGVTTGSGVRGYVPDVNAGNYSTKQLKELGLHECG